MPSPPVILCVDDNAAGLFTRKLLLEAKGFRILTASDGPTGLAIVDREPVDAVLLDYKMPGMDGDEVARRLRSTHPNIPIVMLSGFPHELPETLVARIDGSVVKGDPLENLIQELERVTGSKAKPPIDQPATLEGTRRAMERAKDLVQDSSRLSRKYGQRRKT